MLSFQQNSQIVYKLEVWLKIKNIDFFYKSQFYLKIRIGLH